MSKRIQGTISYIKMMRVPKGWCIKIGGLGKIYVELVDLDLKEVNCVYYLLK